VDFSKYTTKELARIAMMCENYDGEWELFITYYSEIMRELKRRSRAIHPSRNLR
jgi:hypothetical protein